MTIERERERERGRERERESDGDGEKMHAFSRARDEMYTVSAVSIRGVSTPGGGWIRQRERERERVCHVRYIDIDMREEV